NTTLWPARPSVAVREEKSPSGRDPSPDAEMLELDDTEDARPRGSDRSRRLPAPARPLSAIAIRAAWMASAWASWCVRSSRFSARATNGREYEPSVRSLRAIGSVSYHAAAGASISKTAQTCWSTERSKGALWASRSSPPMKPMTSGKTRSHAGASRTDSGVMPWIATCRGAKSSSPSGGAINQVAVSITAPSRTLARPTAHAEAREGFAVSKSIAVKSSDGCGDVSMSRTVAWAGDIPDANDTGGRPSRDRGGPRARPARTAPLPLRLPARRPVRPLVQSAHRGVVVDLADVVHRGHPVVEVVAPLAQAAVEIGAEPFAHLTHLRMPVAVVQLVGVELEVVELVDRFGVDHQLVPA